MFFFLCRTNTLLKHSVGLVNNRSFTIRLAFDDTQKDMIALSLSIFFLCSLQFAWNYGNHHLRVGLLMSAICRTQRPPLQGHLGESFQQQPFCIRGGRLCFSESIFTTVIISKVGVLQPSFASHFGTVWCRAPLPLPRLPFCSSARPRYLLSSYIACLNH